jgi:hypothetical protein
MEQDKQKINSEHPQKPAAPTPLMAAVVEANKARSQRREGEVPQFNLAEQIMTQQRKATAVKRKAPTAKIEPIQSSVEPNKASGFMTAVSPRVSNHARIVAEIVARDIRLLCRGKSAVIS